MFPLKQKDCCKHVELAQYMIGCFVQHSLPFQKFLACSALFAFVAQPNIHNAVHTDGCKERDVSGNVAYQGVPGEG